MSADKNQGAPHSRPETGFEHLQDSPAAGLLSPDFVFLFGDPRLFLG